MGAGRAAAPPGIFFAPPGPSLPPLELNPPEFHLKYAKKWIILVVNPPNRQAL